MIFQDAKILQRRFGIAINGARDHSVLLNQVNTERWLIYNNIWCDKPQILGPQIDSQCFDLPNTRNENWLPWKRPNYSIFIWYDDTHFSNAVWGNIVVAAPINLWSYSGLRKKLMYWACEIGRLCDASSTFQNSNLWSNCFHSLKRNGSSKQTTPFGPSCKKKQRQSSKEIIAFKRQKHPPMEYE